MVLTNDGSGMDFYATACKLYDTLFEDQKPLHTYEVEWAVSEFLTLVVENIDRENPDRASMSTLDIIDKWLFITQSSENSLSRVMTNIMTLLTQPKKDAKS